MPDGKTAAWPIPTGAWGRPAGAGLGRAHAAAVPTPVPVVAPVAVTRRRSPRWRTAAVEAVIAAALLAGIAVTAPGSATSPVPRPLAQWGRAEIPVLDALIADTDATVSSHGARLGPLEAEVAAAAHMPPPPDPNVATVWYRALGELAGGVEALAGGTPGQSPAALAALSSGAGALATVEQSLGQ